MKLSIACISSPMHDVKTTGWSCNQIHPNTKKVNICEDVRERGRERLGCFKFIDKLPTSLHKPLVKFVQNN